MQVLYKNPIRGYFKNSFKWKATSLMQSQFGYRVFWSTTAIQWAKLEQQVKQKIWRRGRDNVDSQ